MSVRSVPSVSPSAACCLDAVEAILGFGNVWIENPAGNRSAGLDLRCVALAVEPSQLESTLETLAQAPAPIDPQIYPHAAITHLYADGRSEQCPIVQIEFVARLEHIASILEKLQAAGKLAPAKDRMVIIRGLASSLGSDCQIFPAGAKAPYSHFVRWRQAPDCGSAELQHVESSLRLAMAAEGPLQFSEILAAAAG